MEPQQYAPMSSDAPLNNSAAQESQPSSLVSQPTRADRTNIIIYSVVLVLVFIALGCAVFLFSMVKSQDALSNLPTTTSVAATQTPAPTTAQTLTSNDVQKPANSQAAITKLNSLQSTLDSNASSESADYSSLNADLSNTSTSSSEQSSINNL